MAWLAEQAQQSQVIVEIGSHLGRSNHVLADNMQGKIIAVDDWYGPRDTVIAHSERMKLYQQFGINLLDSPAALDLRLLLGKSLSHSL